MNRVVGDIPIEPFADLNSPAPEPEKERPRVLLVDDDERNLLAIATVLEDLGEVVLARSGEEALRHLLKGEFAVILLDAAHEAGLKGVVSTAGAGTLAMARKLQPSAITLDLGLADIDGFVLLDLLKHDPQINDVPIHVISGADRRQSAMRLGAAGVTEKPAERDDLISVFAELREQAQQHKPRRKAKASPQQAQIPELAGAKVLIVDDDIRNIFSLTSVLESHNVEVLHAERGKDGILILEQTPGVDIALIDIMMPEMDGYETMRQIRRRPELADLPLISVTAKAMKGDRQKCLDAGASDYIAKPVDIELLLALLRVWVGRSREAAAASAASVAAE